LENNIRNNQDDHNKRPALFRRADQLAHNSGWVSVHAPEANPIIMTLTKAKKFVWQSSKLAPFVE
jgi:hypothetical protein